MKKIKKILLLILLVLFCSSCGTKNNLKDMSYSDFKEKLKDKETFFFVVIKDGCQYCEKYIPKVEEIVEEYDIVGYKLNYSELSDDDNDEFYNEYGIGSTPTTVFIKDGKEISILQRIEGNVAKEKLIDKLEKNGYIKQK